MVLNWNLTNNNDEDYCIAWRKSLQRLWSHPYNSSQLSTTLTSSTILLFNEICHCVTNFINACMHCDCHFIRSIALYGIKVSCTNSPIGWKATFCSLHHDIGIDNIFSTKLSNHCFARFKSELSTDLLARVTLYARLYRLETVSLHCKTI